MKDTKETKPVSFRLPTEVFDALQNKGQSLELSAHELASKIVQENYQVHVEAVVVKEAVTCSKQVFLPPPTKQVFHFSYSDLKSICIALSGKRYPSCHIQQTKIGYTWEGITRISEDLWEVIVETSNVN